MSISLYKSNYLEQLLAQLISKIREDQSSPLAPCYIVVPSPAMRWYLQLGIVDQRGIAAGMQWIYLDEIPKIFFEKSTAPQHLQLSLKVEKWLCKHHSCSAKQRVTLADTVAHLFVRYAFFGEKMTQNWCKKGVDWQQNLWVDLYKDCDTVRQKWLRPPLRENKGSLHLFGVSFLGACQLQGLLELAKTMPTTLYQLAPTPHYWGDVISDRESEWLQEKSEKQNSSLPSRMQLEDSLLDRMRLLANCGAVGREMANLIEDLDIDVQDCFTTPLPTSLLQAIQRDLLDVRNPALQEIEYLPEEDQSVQVHVCSTPFREVESLYDTILYWIDKEGLSPSDIVVMAPDIAEYAPYIKMVMAGSESSVPIKMLDLPLVHESEATHTFVLLLSFATSRWKAKDFIELLAMKPFRSAIGIEREEMLILIEWIKEYHIRWGFDGVHREQTLQCSLEQPLWSTWEFGCQWLIDDLLQESQLGFDPDLVGRFVEVLYRIKEDLAPLVDEQMHSVKGWADYLHDLLDTYVVADSDVGIEKMHLIINRFYVELLSEDDHFCFESIHPRLVKMIEGESTGWREWVASGIRCCSLLPMRAVPAKAICLLGLSDDCFPRKEQVGSHDRLKFFSEKEYDPDRNDFDRFLFLESILSAREKLYLSYAENKNAVETSGASLLIRELLHYCDSGYKIGLSPPSKACVVQHPVSSFASEYFSKHSPVPCYQIHRYKGAVTRLQEPKPPRDFLQNWLTFSAIKGHTPEKTTYQIQDLLRLARHPIRFFLSSSLGLYYKDDPMPDDRDRFALSHLEQAIVARHDAAEGGKGKFVDQVQKRGHLPSGIFGAVARQRLDKEISRLSLLAKEKTFFSVELRIDCTEPLCTEKGWILPALQLREKGDPLLVVGVITEITEDGIVDVSKAKGAFFKLWPLLLIQSCLAEKYPEIFSKKAKQFPLDQAEKSLFQYLLYADLARSHPSPLQPEWIEEIAKGSSDRLFRIYQANKNRIKDPYMDRAFSTTPPPFVQIVQDWHEGVHSLFSLQEQDCHALI